MKNRLLFPIMFAFIFSACSNFSGNEDEVEASLKPIKVTKQEIEEEEEEDDTPKPRTWYDLYGVTFGDNTFVAVGEKGTVRTSSDNGTTWDNGTYGTTRNLKEIAYGDQSFVTVGDYGTILYSSDNGATWDNATWSGSDRLTGIAYGNNTFIGAGSEKVIRSTDKGLNWITGSEINVYDVAFGDSTFIGSGADGALFYSSSASPYNNGENWLTITAIVDDKLYGITYGNNQFLAVGGTYGQATQSGTVIYSRDNGTSWNTTKSNASGSLYSVAFGNDKFVGVGYYTVIVSDKTGTAFIEKYTERYFRDISFGNGIFVSVGDDENIYTSADGDTWTKVYGK